MRFSRTWISRLPVSVTASLTGRPRAQIFQVTFREWLSTWGRHRVIPVLVGQRLPRGEDSRDFIGDQIKDVKNQSVITIFGGTNDFAANRPIGTVKDSVDKVTTFCGAFKYMVTNLAKQNPQVKFLLITPAKSNHAEWRLYDGDGNLRKNQLGNTFIDYVKAVKTIGSYFAIPVLDVFNDGNYNPYLFPNLSLEGLHPNAKGHERLAKTIAFKINSL